jgi:hypothetical protein
LIGPPSGEDKLLWIERVAIEPKLFADIDENLEIVRLGSVLGKATGGSQKSAHLCIAGASLFY